MKPLWSGFLLSLSLCLDLGLVNLAVLSTALQRGGSAGFVLGLGSCFGDLVYFTLAVVGVAALIAWTPFRWAIWLGGTSVLLFLTCRMIRAAMWPHELKIDGPATRSERSPARLLGWGMALALGSPTGILWYAAVGGSVIASFGGDRRQLLPFAVGFFLAGVIWSGILSYGTGYLRRVGGRRVTRVLSLVSAILFLYFAISVFFQGLGEMM